MDSPTFPNLDGLVGLAKTSGVDIRPTLLRVLTDLYLQKPRHTVEEERHYTELALRLIDAVDAPVRATVAWKLASYPAAPLPIVDRLARDILDVAMPLLKYSRVLSKHDLLAIAADLGDLYATVIAGREDFEPVASTDLAPDPSLEERTPEAVDLCELFLAADADERRLILLHLDVAPIPPAIPIDQALARDAIRRLELAALQRHTDEFIDGLVGSLGFAAGLARRLVEDMSGEPIVIVAKALGMSPAILQRIVLFLNPAVGRSVQRVYDLVKLHDEISLGAAMRLLAIWRDAAPIRHRTLAHQPHLWENQPPRPRVSQVVQSPIGRRVIEDSIPERLQKWA